MQTLWQDIRYGVRMLLKAPSFSIVAAVALALGIGANTAIFSVVNAVLWRPLPFPNSEQLMMVWETDKSQGMERGLASYANFTDWQDQSHVFERMASYHNSDYILTGHGESTRLQGGVVSAGLFPLLGVKPVIGRGFLPDEDKPGESGRMVLLSQGLFQRRFNSDLNVVGQSMVLDGKNYTIVGVMPQAFQFPIQNEPVELWTTVAIDREGREPITANRGPLHCALGHLLHDTILSCCSHPAALKRTFQLANKTGHFNLLRTGFRQTGFRQAFVVLRRWRAA